MNAPRIGFAGTPEFAAVALRALVEAGYVPAVVYTQPDRRSGRGRKLQPGPVKRVAQSLGCALQQPTSLRNNPQAIASLADYQLDLMIVAAYGLLLPEPFLATPRLGCVNIHASLLPRWRGAAPIQRALLAGDSETGISIMQMDAGLDTGPVLLQQRCPIDHGMTGGELHDRLAQLGGTTLIASLAAILSGSRANATDQAELAGEVSYAAKLTKSEARLDWLQPAQQLVRQILAFNPWPTAYTELNDPDPQRLRVLRARQCGEQTSEAAPGSVLSEGAEGICVAAGDGRVVALTELQLAGRKPLPAAAFSNARSLLGQRLGLGLGLAP